MHISESSRRLRSRKTIKMKLAYDDSKPGIKKNWRLIMGRSSVDIPDELEKKLRLKTVERFGGKKGDLSRAVEAAVKAWTAAKE